MTFDPTPYLIEIKGNPYLPVQWRLLWVRTEHPDAEITTERVSYDPQTDTTEFKAIVTIPCRGSATGWALEKAGRGPYPPYEKAETAALGRALAALGFGTQFAPELAEGTDDDGPRPVDSPTPRPAARQAAPPARPTTPNPSSPIRRATSQQLAAIMALGTRLLRHHPRAARRDHPHRVRLCPRAAHHSAGRHLLQHAGF